MRRGSKNPNNLWLLLALPVIGAVGWVTSRLLSRRKLDRRYPFPASTQTQSVDIPGGSVQDAAFPPAASQASRPGALAVSEPAMAADVPVGQALENQPERLATFLVLMVLFLALPV